MVRVKGPKGSKFKNGLCFIMKYSLIWNFFILVLSQPGKEKVKERVDGRKIILFENRPCIFHRSVKLLNLFLSDLLL